jgi:uncharacterized protein
VFGRRLTSSRIAVVEVTKAVARANPGSDPAAVLALVSFIEVDADLVRIAAATGGPALRALDAIHVASALRLGAEVDAFVTYDSRQAAAAQQAGFRIEAPT